MDSMDGTCDVYTESIAERVGSGFSQLVYTDFCSSLSRDTYAKQQKDFPSALEIM